VLIFLLQYLPARVVQTSLEAREYPANLPRRRLGRKIGLRLNSVFEITEATGRYSGRGKHGRRAAAVRYSCEAGHSHSIELDFGARVMVDSWIGYWRARTGLSQAGIITCLSLARPPSGNGNSGRISSRHWLLMAEKSGLLGSIARAWKPNRSCHFALESRPAVIRYNSVAYLVRRAAEEFILSWAA